MTKEEAARVLVPMDMKVAPETTLSSDEQVDIIYKYLKENGFEGKKDDVNVSWGTRDIYRSRKPSDINIITVYENGKAKYYLATDPLLYDMYASSNDVHPYVEIAMKELAAATRNFTRPITESLLFGVRNAAWRDPQRAIVRGEEKRMAIPFYALARGIVGRMAGTKVGQKIKGAEKLSNAELRNAAELLSHSFTQSESSIARQLGRHEIVKMLAEGWHDTSIKVNKPTRIAINLVHPANWINALVKPIDMFNYAIHSRQANMFFESVAREGAALTKLDTGGSLQDALAAYSDITGRFGARPGSATVSSAITTMPFANANAQIGYETLMDMSSPDPKVRNRVIGRYVFLSLAGAALAALKLVMSDDEDDEREHERPTESKARYFDIKGIRMPFGSGLEGLMVNAGYTAVMAIANKEYIRDKKLFAKTVLSQAGQSIGVDASVLPPLAKAYKNAEANWDPFFKSHIVSPYLEGYSPEVQYSASTPEFYKKIGQWVHYSPTKIQYIVRSGVARQIDEAIRVTNRWKKGEPLIGKGLPDAPVIGGLFIKNPTGWRSESVRQVSEYEKKYKSYRKKLRDSDDEKDQSVLKFIDGKSSGDDLPPELVTQLNSMILLHKTHNELSKLSDAAKNAESVDHEEYIKELMMLRAQAALSGNEEFIKKIDSRIMNEGIFPKSKKQPRKLRKKRK